MSLSVVVLAGGKGERMGGVVKPLLAGADGRTLLERIEAELSPLTAELAVIVPETLVRVVAPKWRGRVVVDRGVGPGAALVDAARAIGSTWILLVGGDHVATSRRLAERLFRTAEAACAAGQPVDLVRVVRDGVPEPLFALYRTEAVRARAAGGASHVALRSFAAGSHLIELEAESLEADERRALDDVDTTDDAKGAGLALDPGETG